MAKVAKSTHTSSRRAETSTENTVLHPSSSRANGNQTLFFFPPPHFRKLSKCFFDEHEPPDGVWSSCFNFLCFRKINVTKQTPHTTIACHHDFWNSLFLPVLLSHEGWTTTLFHTRGDISSVVEKYNCDRSKTWGEVLTKISTLALRMNYIVSPPGRHFVCRRKKKKLRSFKNVKGNINKKFYSRAED